MCKFALMGIVQNLQKVQSSIPHSVTLVAVSKTKPDQDIMACYEVGQRVFGENKVQELSGKYERLPKDIQWHMIGHLQTNKVKYIAPFVSLIHGVDSFKLLVEINKQAIKNNRIIPVLLQFHIAQEETKFGLSLEEAKSIITSTDFEKLKNVELQGVMGMASYTENEAQVAKEFGILKDIFDDLKQQANLSSRFQTISMGMSGDYQIAIKQGSNMIRVGSTIFGNRNYDV